MERKKRPLTALRVFSFLLGLSFAFVSGWWKIGILVIALGIRALDADSNHRLKNAAALFFIGVIASYVLVLILGDVIKDVWD